MRNWIVVLVLATLGACKAKDKIPAGILPREKMETVFWDMLQADEFARDFVFRMDSTRNDTLELIEVYEEVFRLHKTSRSEFSNSFSWYRQHPPIMKDILDSLMAKAQNASIGAPPISVDTGFFRKTIAPL